MRSSALRTLIAAMAILIAGCTASPESRPIPAEPTSTVDASPTPAEPTSTADAGTPAPSPHPPITSLGDFPEFPRGPSPSPSPPPSRRCSTGRWRRARSPESRPPSSSATWGVVGAAGVDRELNPMPRDAPLPTASVGKTIIAAQVLRLAEQGKLGLDDPAADHLPRELESFDTNGATVRHLLSMRSGIPDPDPRNGAATDEDRVLPDVHRRPRHPAGSGNQYSNTDFVLLEVILEAIAHRPIEEVLRNDVLSGPGLGPLRQTASGSIAFDAVRESDSASLARWGYELYGGSVLSDASLRQMTEFYDGYGLGAVDFSPLPGLDEAAMEALPWCCYDVPAIGHGGAGASDALALVAFPQTDVVVVVQAQYAGLDEGPRISASPDRRGAALTTEARWIGPRMPHAPGRKRNSRRTRRPRRPP